jgi:hypothetical protein
MAAGQQSLAAIVNESESPNDRKLMVLGRRFDSLASEIDGAIEYGSYPRQNTLEELSRVESEIVATPATTISGLRVKARAACWALLGDLQPEGESTTDKRMALSMVRDLIRRYDSHLERPGALAALLEFEETKSK